MSECLRPLREKRIRLNSWNSCQLLERAIAVVDDFEFGPVQNLFDQFKSAFERRKKRVALDDPFDEREVKVGTKRQGLFVNLRAATNKIVQGRIHRAEFQKVFNYSQVDCGHTANSGKFKLVGKRNCCLAACNPRLTKKKREFPLQQSWMPTEHDVDPIGQRFAKTLEGFSSDDDDIALGHFLEPFKIIRQMPRNFVSRADDTVFRHRRDGFEVIHHNFGSILAPCHTVNMMTQRLLSWT